MKFLNILAGNHPKVSYFACRKPKNAKITLKKWIFTHTGHLALATASCWAQNWLHTLSRVLKVHFDHFLEISKIWPSPPRKHQIWHLVDFSDVLDTGFPLFSIAFLLTRHFTPRPPFYSQPAILLLAILLISVYDLKHPYLSHTEGHQKLSGSSRFEPDPDLEAPDLLFEV